MLLYGDDFFFSNIHTAKESYSKIEHLKDFANKMNSTELTIKITTASQYFDAVKITNTKFSSFRGDFFPYQSEKKGIWYYWTGYFSTRPELKQTIVETHRLDRAAEIAKALVHSEALSTPEASFALHHDAITGTCRPKVLIDYMDRCLKEQENAVKAINEVFTTLLSKSEISFQLANPYKIMIIYNPLNWGRNSLLMIDSKSQNIEVID